MLGPLVWVVLRVALARHGINLDTRALLVSGLLYPLLEELAFRGALQSWLLERGFSRVLIPGVSAANVLTSLAFSLAHLYNQPPLWAAATFLPSLVFGYFRERSDGLAAPIILHAWYNLGFILLVIPAWR